MRDGTVFFPNEPVLEVQGQLLEAQIVETALINLVHLSTLMASRAARCVDAAAGRRLVEFGLRRAHGGEAGLEVARASFLAGFDATSNVLAGERYGIPIAGTMAHSYIEALPGRARGVRGVPALVSRREHAPDRHLRHGRGSAACGRGRAVAAAAASAASASTQATCSP